MELNYVTEKLGLRATVSVRIGLNCCSTVSVLSVDSADASISYTPALLPT